MKKQIYPITITDYKKVASLYVKNFFNTIKEVLIDIAYESTVLVIGLWIAVKILKYIPA